MTIAAVPQEGTDWHGEVSGSGEPGLVQGLVEVEAEGHGDADGYGCRADGQVPAQ